MAGEPRLPAETRYPRGAGHGALAGGGDGAGRQRRGARSAAARTPPRRPGRGQRSGREAWHDEVSRPGCASLGLPPAPPASRPRPTLGRPRTRPRMDKVGLKGFQNQRARQASGIRRPWRPFPVPAAPGGERGVGGGTGGGDHQPDRGPAVRDRSATPPTIRVVGTLRSFVRGGVRWRGPRAAADRARGSTLRRRPEGRGATALPRRVHVALVRMVRAGPEGSPRDVVVDSRSVRAGRGGELTGPDPTDRGERDRVPRRGLDRRPAAWRRALGRRRPRHPPLPAPAAPGPGRPRRHRRGVRRRGLRRRGEPRRAPAGRR